VILFTYLPTYLPVFIVHICADADESSINAVSLHLYNPHHFTVFRLGNSSSLQTTSRRPCWVWCIYGSVSHLYCTQCDWLLAWYCCLSIPLSFCDAQAVLAVQWFGIGLMIKRSLVRLPAGALSSQLG